YEAHAGYADGRMTATTFAKRAADLGAQVLEGTAVHRIRVSGGRVVGVETSDGPIDSPTVVVAASTGSPALMAAVGRDFPIAFEREWVCFVRRPWPIRD